MALLEKLVRASFGHEPVDRDDQAHTRNQAGEPAFWFGHGLGYSTWEYSKATVVADDDDLGVEVTVTNTGDRPSREVVQLYFQPAESDQPVRLVGWQPVTAEPGESATVTVTADRRMWRRWDTAANAWAQLSGDGRLLIARGLGDVRAQLQVGAAAAAD